MITIALVGRPNSGKSSLYNQLTGGHARVGNYPGITVDVLEADVNLPSGALVKVADLPGLYSVETNVAKDTDEGVARAFLDNLRQIPDDARSSYVVVQVLDPTRLALGLRLTKELAAQKIRLIVALTHRDVLASEGREIDLVKLEAALGAKVVLVSARDPSCKGAVFAAVDDRLRDHDASPPNASFDPVKLANEVVRELPSTTEIARRRAFTERLDAVLLHPVIGPVLFLGLMALVFACVFLIADPVTALSDLVLGYAKGAITRVLGKGLLASFLADGILGGAGTVLVFMPQIVILTVALEVLEASGYLARGAFLVDRLLRLMGLSGRSFLPLLMGHACAIPAINATRIVRDPKERLTAMLVLPLMTCSARIPTYALIVGTFFFRASVLTKAAIFVSLYFAGLLAGLVASLVIRRTTVKGTSLPLVLEMPAYRRPQVRVVLRQAARAAVRFLREVGTTIVLASSILWAVLTLPSPFAGPAVEGTPPIERSVAASVGRGLEPITRPLGFDWRLNVGLIGSFGARELMVGTLGIINGIDDAGADPSPLSERLRTAKRPDGQPQYPARTGLAILAFFVLACQCMSTVAAVKRETRSYKWPAFLLAYTYAAAYVAAFVVHGLAKLAGF